MAGKKLRGIYAMLVTPFNSNEDIDYDALRAEVDWCAEVGVDGIVATPSIGEFACLTNEERWKSWEVAGEQADKHGLTKLCTVAAPYTREVLEHCKVAKELKFDGAQLIPPYYWIPDETEVYRHYQEACATGLPIVIYHNPKLSKFFMSREFVGKLTKIDGVIGMKEVMTDRHIHLESLFKEIDGRAPVFTTFRAFTTGMLLGSGGGFINAFAVPACVKMWQLWNNGGDRDRIEAIQCMVNEAFPRGGEDNQRHIGTTKMVTSTVSGINMGSPRAPYMLPEAHVEAELKKALPKLNELLQD
ncbi:MAG: dihydrodipicolinate synthase family protein [Deltaproteobacteria bacterium]|nr:dihydrodipicolinate synthase family protein [Deltaproteobacteria bacterium]